MCDDETKKDEVDLDEMRDYYTLEWSSGQAGEDDDDSVAT